MCFNKLVNYNAGKVYVSCKITSAKQEKDKVHIEKPLRIRPDAFCFDYYILIIVSCEKSSLV